MFWPTGKHRFGWFPRTGLRLQLCKRSPAIHRYERSVVPSLVTIVSGDIVRQLKLQQRVPALCSALGARKFFTENDVTLVRRSGPKFGMTATWEIFV
jgi:hypothetical protein